MILETLSSETSVLTRLALHYIPKDGILRMIFYFFIFCEVATFSVHVLPKLCYNLTALFKYRFILSNLWTDLTDADYLISEHAAQN
jgi:hypothetical protein